MGWETANVHLGNASAVKSIRKDLGKQKANWLYAAASAMADAVKRDWQVWRKSGAAES
jgi:hypothetical protein